MIKRGSNFPFPASLSNRNGYWKMLFTGFPKNTGSLCYERARKYEHRRNTSLNISKANVKLRLSRAKALLRNSLSSYYNKEEIFHFHLSRCDWIMERVLKQIDSL
jgi:hypothetical protein